jgi:hypothetical protein
VSPTPVYRQPTFEPRLPSQDGNRMPHIVKNAQQYSDQRYAQPQYADQRYVRYAGTENNQGRPESRKADHYSRHSNFQQMPPAGGQVQQTRQLQQPQPFQPSGDAYSRQPHTHPTKSQNQGCCSGNPDRMTPLTPLSS